VIAGDSPRTVAELSIKQGLDASADRLVDPRFEFDLVGVDLLSREGRSYGQVGYERQEHEGAHLIKHTPLMNG
jgi:hypothetical protein